MVGWGNIFPGVSIILYKRKVSIVRVGCSLRVYTVDVFSFTVFRLQIAQTSDDTFIPAEAVRGGDGLTSSPENGVVVGRDHEAVGLGDYVPRIPFARSATSPLVCKCLSRAKA